MLENVTAAIARVEEIKAYFNSARTSGVVSIAPHSYASGPVSASNSAQQSASVQPFFPSYLLQTAQTVAKDTSSGNGASGYKSMIESAAAKYGVDPALISAVIKAESGFNPNAVSSVGAQGLMQLMPSTAKALGCSNPFDPAQNIEAGTKYIKQQLDRFGSTDCALAAYNAGPGAVAKYNGVPPYRETQGYVKKVLSYREDYSQ
ncbi:MAG: lytic transglycosylase domain-containing protein [Armatimonadota bacterium]